MELTPAQDDYINNIVEDWNRMVSSKSPKDFVKDELDLAIVTSSAAMAMAAIETHSSDPQAGRIWGLIILGAFLHNEGLMHVDGKDNLQ